MRKNENAMETIDDLKKNHPDYYRSLYPECQKCQNILSSYECDICEEFDMFIHVEDRKNI